MPTHILHIDSSPMGSKSVSRQLSHQTVQELLKKHPGATVTVKDLASTPLPHIDGTALASWFSDASTHTPEQKAALERSNQAVAEVMQADIIVIGSPMWNFGIPSSLKAWVDHICRAGLTFRYTATGAEGLIPAGKQVIITSARGGMYAEGAAQAFDFQEKYLKTVLGFLGLTHVHTIQAEGLNMGEEAREQGVKKAQKQLAEIMSQI